MLKQRYGVASERTVQKALELLAAEGLVASQGREPYKVISAEPRQSLETRVDILEEQFRKVRDRLGIVEAKLLGAEEEARERTAGDDRAQDEASRDPEPETETVARRQ
jgi:DNA-binding GntR family transcriptional regulator